MSRSIGEHNIFFRIHENKRIKEYMKIGDNKNRNNKGIILKIYK